MIVGAYRFGHIDVDGHTFNSDVIITPERVVENWRRKEGHCLAVADVANVVAAKPDIVVLGTGFLGRMTVSDEVRRYLEAQGIEVRAAPTRQAVRDFRQLQDQRARVVAALHLTC